jgi:cell division inhibitor SepF
LLGLVVPDDDEGGYAPAGVGEIQDDGDYPGDQLAAGGVPHIAIVRPRNFQDVAIVGEYFRQEVPVIINLEDLDNGLATRIIDFVSGLILGLCGDIERISRRTFLIVPAGAVIMTTHDGLTQKGFFNQA